MVFTHKDYSKARRDTWVHEFPNGEELWSPQQSCTKSPGAVSTDGCTRRCWMLVTRGWSRQGRRVLIRGKQDAKEWTAKKVPWLKRYPQLPTHSHYPIPQVILGWGTIPQRPAQVLGSDRHRVGWGRVGAKQSREWRKDPTRRKRVLG